MLKPWKKISTETAVKNPWWEYRKDIFELPSGKRGEYHYTHHNGAVIIIPVLESGKILFVKQFRYLYDRFSVELPTGSISAGESAEEAAVRELDEECSMRGQLKMIGRISANNGISDGWHNIFLATNLQNSKKHQQDETEEFEYMELSLDDVERYIANGEIFDGGSIVAMHLYAKNNQKII